MRSNRTFVRALVALSATTIFAACAAANNDAASSSASLSTFCSSLCNRINACDNGSDMQTCSEACKNENAAAFPKLRGDLVQAIEGCLSAKDCKTVLSSDVVSTCSKEALASMAPSDTGTHLCDDLAAMTSCMSVDRAQCLDQVKVFNDDVLRDADACTQKACSQVKSCLSAVLDVKWSASSSASSGSTPDAGPPETTATCGGSDSIDMGSAECDACGHSSCCSERAACIGYGDCWLEVSCRQACAAGDDACRQSCADVHYDGDLYLQSWASCLRTTCGATCSI